MIWKVIDNGKTLYKKCTQDSISASAAQAAFFLLLSLIPVIMVLSALLQYTVVSEAMVLGFVKEVMPQYISPFLISVIHEVYNKPVGIVSATALVAIWSSAKGVQYTAAGLNRIHGIKETRNWFVRRFWAIVYTMIFLLAIVISLVFMVFGNSIQRMLTANVTLFAHIAELIFSFRGVIMLIIMGGIFTVLYRTLPNTKELQKKKLTLKNQFPGAMLCAVSWYVFSFGISVYVDFFNGFSMYGSLTTIVLLMLWLYFGMYSMLVCAQINVLFVK